MSDHIPFVNSDGDFYRFERYFSDSKIFRVSLEYFSKTTKKLPPDYNYWIDGGIDGYDHILNGRRLSSKWEKYIGNFKENNILGEEKFIKKPDYKKLFSFTSSLLDECKKYNPAWITVPQLPIIEGGARNRVNRELAKATSEWKLKSKFDGKFILPLIFTHQDQLKGKTQWNSKIITARTCYNDSGASAIWAVDSDLSDQKCRERFPKRFEALINFHIDLKNTFPSSIIIAGPYWGMNIVLWVIGLCDHPAVCLGTAYRYYLSGGFMKRGVPHIALPPLRRWVSVNNKIRDWLIDVIGVLPPTDAASKEFNVLKRNFERILISEDAARNQTAKFYKYWFDKIESVNVSGRSLALYQDLSSAYVLGKQLLILPRSEAPGREPGKVAEQLMLHCL